MGEVIVTFKVMPTGSDVDMDKLEANIKGKIRADRISREPIAFGLIALKVITIIQDAEGELEKVESALRSIEDVNGVEVTNLTKTL